MKPIILLLFCILCCSGICIAQDDCSQKMGYLPSMFFSKGKAKISVEAQAVLSMVASKIKANPGCTVVVTGYCGGSKEEIQLSWDRVNAVVTGYFVKELGIAPERFIFKYAQKGDECGAIDFRAAAAGETGPSLPDPPYPSLMKG